MKLTIHTLEKTLFDGTAKKLIAQTAVGEITVLDGHLPLISLLKGPSVKIVDTKDNNHFIEIKSGFIEVRPESEVVILAN